ncbi:MAG TPA: alpha/beta hydrolase [Acidimicrobiales bacterium]|nr:alpha/beta hydrolase [Acidimicrobiales bacterium]
MPLDPTLQMMVDNAAAAGNPRLRDGTVEEARAAYELMAAAGGEPPELAGTEDRTIPGPAGEIPIRVYTPLGDGPFPILLFFHGGGFTIGSIDGHDPVARQLGAQAGALVVSVDYRLAPEARFPAAVEDCFAATQWVATHGAELGGDASRLAVCGDSAGGNLSAVVALLARDAGGPALCFQALIYPTTDASREWPSMVENAAGPFLTADTMAWFHEQYGAGDDAADWRRSPLLAEDLSNLPPALVITAEYDPLRDEGEAYGEKLREAGNTVTIRRYDGMAHAFVQLAGVLPTGREAIAEVATALKLAFS